MTPEILRNWSRLIHTRVPTSSRTFILVPPKAWIQDWAEGISGNPLWNVASLRDSPHEPYPTRHCRAGLQAVPSLRDCFRCGHLSRAQSPEIYMASTVRPEKHKKPLHDVHSGGSLSVGAT